METRTRTHACGPPGAPLEAPNHRSHLERVAPASYPAVLLAEASAHPAWPMQPHSRHRPLPLSSCKRRPSSRRIRRSYCKTDARSLPRWSQAALAPVLLMRTPPVFVDSLVEALLPVFLRASAVAVADGVGPLVSPSALAKAIRAHGITHATLVPLQLVRTRVGVADQQFFSDRRALGVSSMRRGCSRRMM